MNTEIGFGRKVLGVFEDNNLSFEHMPSGIDTMTVFVHQNEFAEKEQQVIAGLHRAVQPDSIDLESDLALIAVVGRGMRRTRGTAGRIFSALAHAHVNVKMIDQGSSAVSYTHLISQIICHHDTVQVLSAGCGVVLSGCCGKVFCDFFKFC